MMGRAHKAELGRLVNEVLRDEERSRFTSEKKHERTAVKSIIILLVWKRTAKQFSS